MTLEQRVEALEKKIAFINDDCFVVKKGEVFISDAFIQDGAITGAEIKAAPVRTAEYSLNSGIVKNAEISGEIHPSNKP